LPEENNRHDDFQETRDPTPLSERQYGVRPYDKTQHRDAEVYNPQVHNTPLLD
jgi:hypothetical protein